ncbi:MAG TPA: hypothetical protein VNZ49_07695 [Bacteroidia bacterium]|jgi:hypothetical protein|nr:hypothetical protein [Bacteroidia bacterium]
MIFFLKHIKRFIPLFASCILNFNSLQAQQSLLFPGDYFFDVQRQKTILADTDVIMHTSLQPFIYKEILPDILKKAKPDIDPFFDKMFYESLIQLRHIDKSSGYNRKFNLNINPIMNFVYGKDMADTSSNSVTTNTRGFWLKGELGKNLTFESAFIENQTVGPAYIYNYSYGTGVMPGQGRWKKFKMAGFDYASAWGILNFRAGKNLTVRLGHGKQKIGNGYRSLLLSDNSFNYPYVQFIASFYKNKIQFSQTYALLMNLTDGGAKTPPGIEPIFQKKAATFQHISWHTCKYLDVYLFQGTIWKATDSNNVMHLDPLYANPVMFTNLAKFGFNNANHIIVGGGFELRPFKKFVFYNQSVYDGTYPDNSNPSVTVNKTNWAMQNGIKYFDVLGVRNLYLQAEVNIVNGQCYTSSKYSAQDYSHYNQLLTTPAWLPNEFVGMVSYYYKRVFIQLKENYFSDNSSKKTITNFDGKIGYLLNPSYNMNLAIGTTLRTYDYAVTGLKPNVTQLIYIAFKTSLYNIYHDF